MKNFKLLACLLLGFLPMLLSSQTISWQKVNGPSGGGNRVYPGKDGYIFTILDQNELYRSNNSGESWQKMPNVPASIWYWPLTVGADGNLYNANSQKIYRSTDNGASWSPISTVNIESVYGLPGGIILTWDYSNNLKRSADDGLTWDTVATNVFTAESFSYNHSTGDVYAWGGNGSTLEPGQLWRSRDQGLTWSLLLENPELESYQMALFSSVQKTSCTAPPTMALPGQNSTRFLKIHCAKFR
jgi:photosystem II stability/assembly factor-like uncharacterized protein